jgi:hypothetical protein
MVIGQGRIFDVDLADDPDPGLALLGDGDHGKVLEQHPVNPFAVPIMAMGEGIFDFRNRLRQGSPRTRPGCCRRACSGRRAPSGNRHRTRHGPSAGRIAGVELQELPFSRWEKLKERTGTSGKSGPRLCGSERCNSRPGSPRRSGRSEPPYGGRRKPRFGGRR